MSEPHFMLRAEVTRFSHGVPCELVCACGGCPDHPTITGTGSTLAECRYDLLAKFHEHAEATS